MPVTARITVAVALLCSSPTLTSADTGCQIAPEKSDLCLAHAQNVRQDQRSETICINDVSSPVAGLDVDVAQWFRSDAPWLLSAGHLGSQHDMSVLSDGMSEIILTGSLNSPSMAAPVVPPIQGAHLLVSPAPLQDEAADSDEEVVQASVAELFRPMHDVRVQGPSSIPPELSAGADVESLQQPQDLSGSYLHGTFPVYYTARGYGVRRAPRNTWRFYCHPLYYEDANLERCGSSKGCCTTACSALHFASRAAITPYLMTLHHHDECVCTLPDCPTCHEFGCDATCPAWSWKAALVQGAAVTGLIYVIP